MVVSYNDILCAAELFAQIEKSVVAVGAAYFFVVYAEAISLIFIFPAVVVTVIILRVVCAVFNGRNMHKHCAFNGFARRLCNAVYRPFIPFELVFPEVVVACAAVRAEVYFACVGVIGIGMSIHHKQRMDDFAVFGNIDDIVAVAHIFGSEFEQTVLCRCELVGAPEFRGCVLTVVVAHYGSPRNTERVDILAKFNI